MSSLSFYELKRKALKKYFGRMNEKQKEAVFAVNGPVLVLAGAGSGKTTVIVNRIANMINFGDAYYDDSYQGSAEDCRFLENYINGRDADLEQLRGNYCSTSYKAMEYTCHYFYKQGCGRA